FGRDETNSSLVNFVAAYGTHPSIEAETTIDGRRAAAALLVNGAPLGQEFMSRIAGVSRYDTARMISSRQFAPNVPVAYLTTGINFPDALAVGPLAAAGPGPVLLTPPSTLPVETALELDRLQPQRIVILGHEDAVSASVEQSLVSSGFGPITRIAGDSRYATAAMISQQLQPRSEERRVGKEGRARGGESHA